jgi:branched-chain amino acid transport system permease protein
MLESLQYIFAPQIINGLSIGVAVILMALGLTIIFGLLDVINMSHGEFYAAGAFLSVSLMSIGISFWWTLILVPMLLIPFGILMQELLIKKVFHHKDRHILTLLLTFGVATILEDIYKIIWGANTAKPATPITGASEVLGVMFPNYRLFLMVFGAALIFAVWLLIYKTSIGSIVRAATLDRDMSASLGIPVNKVYALTFAFGVALAALSGVLLAPIYSVFPTMGKDFILMAFAVVIVGGLGSIKGAVIAGILLTQLQSLSSLYISPMWSDPIVFAVMVLVLMFKPSGLYAGMKNG